MPLIITLKIATKNAMAAQGRGGEQGALEKFAQAPPQRQRGAGLRAAVGDPTAGTDPGLASEPFSARSPRQTTHQMRQQFLSNSSTSSLTQNQALAVGSPPSTSASTVTTNNQ